MQFIKNFTILLLINLCIQISKANLNNNIKKLSNQEIYIFASMTLDNNTFKQVIELANLLKKPIYFLGVEISQEQALEYPLPLHKYISNIQKRITSITDQYKISIPDVIIMPKLFSKYKIDKVPAVVIDTKTNIYYQYGSPNIYRLTKLTNSTTNKIISIGKLFNISEIDIAELIKKRLNKYIANNNKINKDYQLNKLADQYLKKQRSMLNNYYSSSYNKEINLSYSLNHDFYINNNLIANKQQVINPHIKSQESIWIFDIANIVQLQILIQSIKKELDKTYILNKLKEANSTFIIRNWFNFSYRDLKQLYNKNLIDSNKLKSIDSYLANNKIIDKETIGSWHSFKILSIILQKDLYWWNNDLQNTLAKYDSFTEVNLLQFKQNISLNHWSWSDLLCKVEQCKK